MTDRIITGIDVGTYQVKVVIVRVPMKKQGEHTLPQIIGTGYAESRGLRNGYIINEISDRTSSLIKFIVLEPLG